MNVAPRHHAGYDDKQRSYYQGTRPELLVFHPPQAQRVLDVGCGEGRFGAQLAERFGAEVWGVDISAESIEAAATRLHTALHADVSVELDRLPDGHFDAIYYNDVLEHMVDPGQVLIAMQAKLAPGGRVIASLPNLRHFRVLWALLARRDFEYQKAGVMDETHLRFFTARSMRRLFENAGYVDIDVTPIHKSRSFRPVMMKIATLGLIGNDISYPQFAVTAARAAQDAS